MATIVKGDMYEAIDGKLHEIKRQIRQKGGYPYDPARLDSALQAVIEGRFEAVGRILSSLAFPTTYDCSLGLRKLIEVAVGDRNLGNINSDITKERFPLTGTGVRTVYLRVEPFLNNETGEQAAKRLTAAGHTLANTGDLAGFQHDHPKEVEKWVWVVALSKDSRWTDPDGLVMVPYARVRGTHRYFSLDRFRLRFDSCYGVLVRCESGDTRSL